MRFLSVCSGIEAASVAWLPLGWSAWAFSEIDPFACALLRHHYASTPNLGDMNGFKDWPDATVDVLCGGTPCQSFSHAGLRAGLDHPNGQLMLTFGAVAARYRPRWLVWENVPGVLSSDDGRDFGAFLGLLGFLGYGFAYRILDAQFVRVDGYGRAVPQRRNRVFVVGCLGDWRRAAAVLLERESLRGDLAPRRSTGSRVAATLTRGAESSGKGGYAGRRQEADTNIVGSLTASSGPRGHDFADFTNNQAVDSGHLIAFGGNNTTGPIEVATACRAKGGTGHGDFESETFVAHALRADWFDASEDGTGRGTPLVPVYTLAIRGRGDSHQLEYRTDGAANALLTPNGGRGGIGVGAIAFDARQSHVCEYGPIAGPLDTDAFSMAIAFDTTQITSGENRSNPQPGDPCHTLAKGMHAPAVAFPQAMRVRRLTPTECERLMGFPDGYTAIQWRGKPAADGPRYKALGNSWAVNCARWIGRRIALVESIPVKASA